MKSTLQRSLISLLTTLWFCSVLTAAITPPEGGTLFAVIGGKQCADSLPYGPQNLTEAGSLDGNEYYLSTKFTKEHTEWVQIVTSDGTNELFRVFWHFTESKSLEDHFVDAVATGESVVFEIDADPGVKLESSWRFSSESGIDSTTFAAPSTECCFSEGGGVWGAGNLFDAAADDVPSTGELYLYGIANINSSDVASCSTVYSGVEDAVTVYNNTAGVKAFLYFLTSSEEVSDGGGSGDDYTYYYDGNDNEENVVAAVETNDDDEDVNITTIVLAVIGSVSVFILLLCSGYYLWLIRKEEQTAVKNSSRIACDDDNDDVADGENDTSVQDVQTRNLKEVELKDKSHANDSRQKRQFLSSPVKLTADALKYRDSIDRIERIRTQEECEGLIQNAEYNRSSGRDHLDALERAVTESQRSDMTAGSAKPRKKDARDHDHESKPIATSEMPASVHSPSNFSSPSTVNTVQSAGAGTVSTINTGKYVIKSYHKKKSSTVASPSSTGTSPHATSVSGSAQRKRGSGPVKLQPLL